MSSRCGSEPAARKLQTLWNQRQNSKKGHRWRRGIQISRLIRIYFVPVLESMSTHPRFPTAPRNRCAHLFRTRVDVQYLVYPSKTSDLTRTNTITPARSLNCSPSISFPLDMRLCALSLYNHQNAERSCAASTPARNAVLLTRPASPSSSWAHAQHHSPPPSTACRSVSPRMAPHTPVSTCPKWQPHSPPAFSRPRRAAQPQARRRRSDPRPSPVHHSSAPRAGMLSASPASLSVLSLLVRALFPSSLYGLAILVIPLLLGLHDAPKVRRSLAQFDPPKRAKCDTCSFGIDAKG